MRLIDAEALQRVLEEDSALMAQRAKTTDAGFLAVGAGITLAIAAIDAAPTVEVEPVRRAYWIERGIDDNNNVDCYCSACLAGDSHAKSVSVPYCWKCGARMDAQREDGGAPNA